MTALRKKIIAMGVSLLGLVSACSQGKLDQKQLEQLYGEALERQNKKLKVYHLGHSLVGRTMPLMLQQLVGDGHDHRSQLGWGTPLKAHWEPDIPVNGLEEENNHAFYLPFDEAVESAAFDVFVLTEMVEIKAAIKYAKSAEYLEKFVRKITRDTPEAKIYFYETWHKVTDEEGWMFRLERDYKKYWLDNIVDRAHKKLNTDHTIYVIPVGQVMLALFREIEALGGVQGISGPEDFFKRNEDGSLDPIHINELGEYLVALVHYAVLYRQSPEGLPFQLKNEKGELAVAPSEEVAMLMQRLTWQVVSQDYRTGIIPYQAP
ncbi:MAG: hypothetical protein K6L76_07580 [Agarilytica sp.]